MRPMTAEYADDLPAIKVTDSDRNHLEHLLRTRAVHWMWKATAFLVEELGRAETVHWRQVPGDVVTMGSSVLFREENALLDRVSTLTYPSDRPSIADPLSVFTPNGAALLGLAEGQSIDYPLPDGSRKRITVLKVISQPERNALEGGPFAANRVDLSP